MSKQIVLKKTSYHMNESLVSLKLAKFLNRNIPYNQDIVLICIGTDRSTGDSLGPLVGTCLKRALVKHLHIYGTLENPVHAKNLSETIELIQEQHNDPYIVAIDAALGSFKHLKTIEIGDGTLTPGAAVRKKIPPIGDLYIKGYVNVGGFLEYTVLQCTRLRDVMLMAQQIAKAFQYTEAQLAKRKVE